MSGTQVQKVKVVSVSIALSISDCGICEADGCGSPPPESLLQPDRNQALVAAAAVPRMKRRRLSGDDIAVLS
jgi:hypothetical protein